MHLILPQNRLKSAAGHCLWIPTRFSAIYTRLSPLVLSLSLPVLILRSFILVLFFFLIQSYSAPSFSPSPCLSNQPAALISGDISLFNCCHPSTFFPLIHKRISLHQFTRSFCPTPTNVFHYIKTCSFFFFWYVSLFWYWSFLRSSSDVVAGIN